MRGLLFRAREAARVVGPGRLLPSAILWRVRRRYLVLVRDLGSPLPRPPAVPGLRVSALGDAGVPRLLALNPRLTSEDVDGRRRAGEEATLAWLGDDLAGYRWQTALPRAVPFLGTILQPAAGDLLGCGVFVGPAYRRRGIAAALSAWAFDRARAQGFRRVVVLVAALNAPSVRMFERLGFRPVGAVTRCELRPRRPLTTEGAAVLEGESLRVRRADA